MGCRNSELPPFDLELGCSTVTGAGGHVPPDTGDFAPLLTMEPGRGAKANMADSGPHYLESWTFPLAFGMHAWEKTFETELQRDF